MVSSAQTNQTNASTSPINGNSVNYANKPLKTSFQAESAVSTPEPPKVAQTAPEAPKTSNCEELTIKLANLGVSPSDLPLAISIASKESGCRSEAVNRSSGACGEFQSLPCGKWGQPGTNEYLLNAIAYANNRYGGWSSAYSFWQSKRWW